MAIADKLNKLLNTKYAIKHAIKNKGVDIDDDTKFSDYPSKIDAIVTGSGGGNSGGSHYEKIFNVITNDGTDYSYLFHKSTNARIDLSELDTSHVTNMEYMFSSCYSLVDLNLGNFDTSNVTNMSYMFVGCNILTSLNLSNFDTSNVTTMDYMFSSCAKLISIEGLGNFDTRNVTNTQNMFNGCDSLTGLDLSSFNTSKVTNMGYMFYGCKSLTSLDISNFDTSKVTNMGSMFANCESLTELNMSNCDVSKCTSSSSLSNMFGTSYNPCKNLTNLQAPKNISANMDVQYCTALSHDSLMSIINNLITTTSTKTLTLGTTNLAKLTDDEKAIATGKGWTLK